MKWILLMIVWQRIFPAIAFTWFSFEMLMVLSMLAGRVYILDMFNPGIYPHVSYFDISCSISE